MDKGEDAMMRKRVLSTKPIPEEDQNNNQITKEEPVYQIEDINYLRSSSEKMERSGPKEEDDSKPDYSNWKAELRWV